MVTAVRDVVRDVVAEYAAEEVLVLDGIGGLDDLQVTRLLTRRARRREPLGYGLDSIVPMVAPVLWVVLTEATEETTDVAVQGAFGKLRRISKRLIRRRRKTVPMVIPELTRAQIKDVRQKIFERCREAGIEEDRAMALADGVAVRLALDGIDTRSGQVELRSESDPGDRRGTTQ
jgi:hypothetical protein